MFKAITATIAAIFVSTAAFAGCETPELEIGFDVANGNSKDIGGYSNSFDANEEVEFGIKLVIPLGKHVKRMCDAEVAVMNNEAIAEFYKGKELEAKAAKANADARDKNAEAAAAEMDNLEQKIGICKDFTVSTAPQSIKDFCGDLLQN